MPILLKNDSTTLMTLNPTCRWVAPKIVPRKTERPIPGTSRTVTLGDGKPRPPFEMTLIVEVFGTTPADTDDKLAAIHTALATTNRLYPTARYWAVKYVGDKKSPKYSDSRLSALQEITLVLEDPYTHSFPGDNSTREVP